jgi:acetoin utilization protein AcuB
MKSIPQIKAVMTPFPFYVDIQASVREARSMMREHDIHHLPVKDQGELVSVVTRQDIDLVVESLAGQKTEEQIRVRDVCVGDTYIVELTERLDNVLVHMANAHIGSALVVKGGRLAGIFTLSDVCRSFVEHLRKDLPLPGNGGGDVA